MKKLITHINLMQNNIFFSIFLKKNSVTGVFTIIQCFDLAFCTLYYTLEINYMII